MTLYHGSKSGIKGDIATKSRVMPATLGRGSIWGSAGSAV